MRLIDAERIQRRINGTCSLKVISLDNLFFMIAKAPTIDIVYCKECKHWVSDGGAIMFCENTDLPTNKGDYCSYGERNIND